MKCPHIITIKAQKYKMIRSELKKIAHHLDGSKEIQNSLFVAILSPLGVYCPDRIVLGKEAGYVTFWGDG